MQKVVLSLNRASLDLVNNNSFSICRKYSTKYILVYQTTNGKQCNSLSIFLLGIPTYSSMCTYASILCVLIVSLWCHHSSVVYEYFGKYTPLEINRSPWPHAGTCNVYTTTTLKTTAAIYSMQQATCAILGLTSICNLELTLHEFIVLSKTLQIIHRYTNRLHSYTYTSILTCIHYIHMYVYVPHTPHCSVYLFENIFKITNKVTEWGKRARRSNRKCCKIDCSACERAEALEVEVSK